MKMGATKRPRNRFRMRKRRVSTKVAGQPLLHDQRAGQFYSKGNLSLRGNQENLPRARSAQSHAFQSFGVQTGSGLVKSGHLSRIWVGGVTTNSQRKEKSGDTETFLIHIRPIAIAAVPNLCPALCNTPEFPFPPPQSSMNSTNSVHGPCHVQTTI